MNAFAGRALPATLATEHQKPAGNVRPAHESCT